MKLGVWNLCAYGDSSLYSIFNLSNHRLEFLRCFNGLSSHATLSSIKCRNFEKSVSFFNMLTLYNGLQTDSCNWLWETNDGFKLSDSNGNSSAFLRELLIFWSSSIWYIHVLEHLTSFFRQSWENLHFSICNIFSKIFNTHISVVVFRLIRL